MNILELIGQYTQLKHVSADEYAGPCVFCADGQDRFRVWEGTRGNRAQYWCRHCQAKGDAYQFCKDYLHMGHNDILTRLNRSAERSDLVIKPKLKPVTKRDTPLHDTLKWQDQARQAAKWCHLQLKRNKPLLTWLEQDRGIDADTVDAWQLGFNPVRSFSAPDIWGFEPDTKKVFLPVGLTIPHTRPDGTITGLNIRRFKPGDNVPEHLERQGENEPPYIRARGSISNPWALTDGPWDHDWPRVIVESELDALLLWQELSMLAVPVALLTAGAKPESLETSGPVLFSLDFDDAGKKHFVWWSQKHSSVPAPPVKGKDITDMYRAGVDVLQWFKLCLANAGQLTPDRLNPWAHFTLTCGQDWSRPPDMPAHIWERCTAIDGPVIRWQMGFYDDAERNATEQEYRRLWGVV